LFKLIHPMKKPDMDQTNQEIGQDVLGQRLLIERQLAQYDQLITCLGQVVHLLEALQVPKDAHLVKKVSQKGLAYSPSTRSIERLLRNNRG
ncbi:hypothetical protein, partial [Spirosoma arboris]